MTVRTVAGSASGIDRGTAGELGAAVVAQSVRFGARAFEDSVTITPDEFYAARRAVSLTSPAWDRLWEYTPAPEPLESR